MYKSHIVVYSLRCFTFYLSTSSGKNYNEHVAEIAVKNSVDAASAKKDATKCATFFTKAPECVIGTSLPPPPHLCISSYYHALNLFHHYLDTLTYFSYNENGDQGQEILYPIMLRLQNIWITKWSWVS